MKLNKLVSTLNMEHEEWLENRRKGIGGSDAGSICGLNPYSSAIAVFQDKTQPLTEKPDNESMRQGRDLEEYVARRFMEETGKKVRKANAIFYKEEQPFMLANVDRLIVGENAGLECKTASAYSADKWKDGHIPESYEIQCHHYMAVTGADAWYIACVILGKEFVWHKIERDEEIIQIQNTPKGTKIWKNKIEGLRGKATGLVFSNFSRARHVKTKEWAKQFVQVSGTTKKNEFFMWFSAAVDTSYSQKSPDTIAFSFLGITNKGKCVVLDEKVYSNAELDTPLAPSDTVKNLIDFLDRNKKEWGLARNAFLDSADQATMQEWNKYKRRNGCIYTLNDAWKQMEIIDRINAQLGWMAFDDESGIEPNFYVLDTCPTYISELETYSWKEDKDNTPEDGHDHMVNSVQYGWIPYQSKIYKR